MELKDKNGNYTEETQNYYDDIQITLYNLFEQGLDKNFTARDIKDMIDYALHSKYEVYIYEQNLLQL